ncbi:MAG TPA: alpha/beta fold hydrolase, partial [Kofleriaceae bacterium]
MNRLAVAFGLAAGLALGCGSHAEPPAKPAPVAKTPSGIDPAAKLALETEVVGFLTKDGDNVPGTLVHATKPGKLPGIVLFAGSGPTDRDWNSKLITGTNGSGKLLAEALASHGAVVLRFDKAQVGENRKQLAGTTLDVYVDEASAALAYLRTRSDVDPSHLYLAGHSEGGIHVLRTAAVEGDRIAGVLLLSATARSLHQILLAQIGAQLDQAAPAQKDALLAPFAKALDDFVAGKPVDPKTATPVPGLQMLLANVTDPKIAALGRGLLEFDPLPVVAKLHVPVFVYNGARDL